MDEVFAGELDVSKRLETLKTSGEAGTSLPPCTLREVAAGQADSGAVLIPALSWDGEDLHLDSYALCRDGEVVGYVEAEYAAMAAVLSGRSMFWTMQVKAENGHEGTVQLHSSGCKVKPVMERGVLQGLSLECTVEGQLLELWSDRDVRDLSGQVERQVGGELGKTAALFQGLGVDGAGLRRQAGLSAPWHWTALEDQWQEAYVALPLVVNVEAKLSEGN